MTTSLTAEVVGAILVCIGARFTGFGTSLIGRFVGKVPTVNLKIHFLNLLK